LPILSWLTLVNVDEMTGQSASDERRRLHARKLREMLVSLGPVFIKVGQALSNRPDIVGPVYVTELEKLQDTVGPFPDHIAYQIIEEELGRPASEVFDIECLRASASLCQVYKARVRATGQVVAVKVQRPNMFRTAEADLAILRTGAGYLQRARKLRSDLLAIVDEFGETLWEELDFIHEGENCKKFRAYYAAPVLEGITAPRVVDELTTKRVLTMEWIEGTKLPWGDDAERLIGLGLECSTYQLLEKGFLHADPHAVRFPSLTESVHVANRAVLRFCVLRMPIPLPLPPCLRPQSMPGDGRPWSLIAYFHVSLFCRAICCGRRVGT
jgi:predicted unusual protein kinase regulating ubiquinone biosynthesis (AarF/ABC1/UbiB family)